jgi:hypothetical protein
VRSLIAAETTVVAVWVLCRALRIDRTSIDDCERGLAADPALVDAGPSEEIGQIYGASDGRRRAERAARRAAHSPITETQSRRALAPRGTGLRSSIGEVR